MLFPFSSDIMVIYFSFQFESVSDWDSVRREVDAASRSVRQLGSLLFEMEVLRSYLEQQDLPYFDQRVEPAKKQALLAIRQLQGETIIQSLYSVRVWVGVDTANKEPSVECRPQ